MQPMIIQRPRRFGKLFSLNHHAKPYWCPLNKEYYLKIKSGTQDCEIRPNNHRGWNVKNIYPGRLITLSNGYQKKGRITKTIMRTLLTHDLSLDIPQWHIDAVEKIYGKRESWLIAFVGCDVKAWTDDIKRTFDQYQGYFSMDERQITLIKRVEKYFAESMQVGFHQSIQKSRSLKQWCDQHGYSSKELHTAKHYVSNQMRTQS